MFAGPSDGSLSLYLWQWELIQKAADLVYKSNLELFHCSSGWWIVGLVGTIYNSPQTITITTQCTESWITH